MSLHVKYSELPEGTVIEITNNDRGARYEKTETNWQSLGYSGDKFSFEDLDLRDDVLVISVPYAVTLQLAEWLDNIYVKSGSFESLVVEAALETKKDMTHPHISGRPPFKVRGGQTLRRTYPAS